MKWNMNNELFVSLFGEVVGEKIKEMNANNMRDKDKLQ